MPFPTLIEQILAASFAVANCDFPRPSAAGVGETFNRQNELLRNLRGGPFVAVTGNSITPLGRMGRAPVAASVAASSKKTIGMRRM